MKKFISVLLSALLITSVICSAPYVVSAAETDDETSIAVSFENKDEPVGASNGTTGDCMWTLDDEGTLIISGNGEMDDYHWYNNAAPWGTKIKKVIIEKGVTRIGSEAFYNCKRIANVSISDSVITIGEHSFYCCTGLKNVVLPNSIQSIEKAAFIGCENLISINIPNDLTSISESTFQECQSLTAITIPDKVTTIGNQAFMWCYALQDVLLGNNIKTIGSYAFCICNISNIALPYSLEYISDGAFYGCSLSELTIPDNVTEIGEKAFYSCDNLSNITIPERVSYIGNQAFYNCNNLIIFGYENSYAIEYAIENNINYSIIPFFDFTTEEPVSVLPTEESTEEPTTCEPTTLAQELKVTSTSNFFPENTQTVLKGNDDTYVTVRYVLENDYQVDSFQWDLKFDSNALELINTNGFMPSVENSNISYNVENNRVRAAASNVLQPYAFYNGSTFVTATFKVLKSGETTVDLNVLVFEETEPEEPTTAEPTIIEPTEEPTTAKPTALEPTEVPTTYEPETYEPTTEEPTEHYIVIDKSIRQKFSFIKFLLT